MVAFDGDYLRKSFLPAMMKDVLTSKSIVLRGDANPPVMMIHPPRIPTPGWVLQTGTGGSRRWGAPSPTFFPECTWRSSTHAPRSPAWQPSSFDTTTVLS